MAKNKQIYFKLNLDDPMDSLILQFFNEQSSRKFALVKIASDFIKKHGVIDTMSAVNMEMLEGAVSSMGTGENTVTVTRQDVPRKRGRPRKQVSEGNSRATMSTSDKIPTVAIPVTANKETSPVKEPELVSVEKAEPIKQSGKQLPNESVKPETKAPIPEVEKSKIEDDNSNKGFSEKSFEGIDDDFNPSGAVDPYELFNNM